MNTTLFRGLLLAALLCLLTPMPSAEAGTPDRLDVLLLLDPAEAAPARVAALDLLRHAADAGDHPSRCLLGRVGLQRQLRPRDFPEADYGDPVAYLNACVLGGDLEAMLVLAENELRQRRPLEAMIWVQAYLKLASLFGNEVVNAAGSYKVGLIQRIERAYGSRRPGNEEVLEYVAGLLSDHGERIASACERGGCSWVSRVLPALSAPAEQQGSGRALMGRFARDSSATEDSALFASFVVEVDARGRTTRVLPLDSFPDGTAARRLSGPARSARFNPIGEGGGPRVLLQTLYVNDPDLKLLPDAAPNTRHRVRG